MIHTTGEIPHGNNIGFNVTRVTGPKTLLPIRLRKGRIYKGRSEQVFTKASLRSPGRKSPLSNKGEQVLCKKPWWFKNSLLQGEFLGVPGGWGGGI